MGPGAASPGDDGDGERGGGRPGGNGRGGGPGTAGSGRLDWSSDRAGGPGAAARGTTGRLRARRRQIWGATTGTAGVGPVTGAESLARTAPASGPGVTTTAPEYLTAGVGHEGRDGEPGATAVLARQQLGGGRYGTTWHSRASPRECRGPIYSGMGRQPSGRRALRHRLVRMTTLGREARPTSEARHASQSARLRGTAPRNQPGLRPNGHPSATSRSYGVTGTHPANRRHHPRANTLFLTQPASPPHRHRTPHTADVTASQARTPHAVSVTALPAPHPSSLRWRPALGLEYPQ